MHRPLISLAAAAAFVVAFWSWLGAPVPMPPSPLAAGEKLYCVSYAPFRGAQSPLAYGTYITAGQIEADLAQLAAITGCVRTYSVEHGVDQVPEIAARFGLRVIQGIWLSSDGGKNRQQIDAAIALARKHPDTIRSLVVGNEVLLRGEMSAADLVGAIREVKKGVAQPVTYADVWEFWLRHRELYAAVDFVTIHVLPYWEDFPIPANSAGAHVRSIRAQVAQHYPDKDILIGETGWPSAGRMREGARPSPVDQARVMHDVVAASRAGGFNVNLIEAYDQPWKRALEGTVGGYWGLIDDAHRGLKFTWGQPVSNHPHWSLQAVGGIVLAVLIFAAGWMARRPSEPPGWGGWAAVGVLAAAAGSTAGLAAESLPLESLGAGGWARTAALGALALLGPIVGAALIARRQPLPTLAQFFGGIEGASPQALARAGAAVLALLCLIAVQQALGLVFDPRYKDFPGHALTGSVVAIVILMLTVPRPRPLRGSGFDPGFDSGLAERATALVLLVSAIWIAFNEGFANWQAQWFAVLLVLLAVSLLRIAGVRRTG